MARAIFVRKRLPLRHENILITSAASCWRRFCCIRPRVRRCPWRRLWQCYWACRDDTVHGWRCRQNHQVPTALLWWQINTNYRHRLCRRCNLLSSLLLSCCHCCYRLSPRLPTVVTSGHVYNHRQLGFSGCRLTNVERLARQCDVCWVVIHIASASQNSPRHKILFLTIFWTNCLFL